MIFANNIPSQSKADSYYQTVSKYEKASIEPIVNEYRKFSIDCVSEIIAQHQSIMDIGCGYGIVLRELYKRGYTNLTAIDPSTNNISALNQSGIAGINDTLFNLEPTAIPKQDCIIFMAVLEHIVDLSQTMKIISDLTADNGIVFVTVPDAKQFLNTADTPYREFSIEHINYFDIRSLTLLFARSGFILEKQWDFPGVITAGFKKLPHAKDSITEYVKQCDEQITRMIVKTKRFRDSQEPILVWGTGTRTQYLLANTIFKDCNIIAFIDSNVHYHGKRLSGKEIIPPVWLKNNEFRNMSIIIST
jgi:SAM-dependent methyltransferase